MNVQVDAPDGERIHDAWRKVFREGLAPLLSGQSLVALEAALEADDPRLLQGYTTDPPAWSGATDWPVGSACLIGFCGLADGLVTVGEVQDYFAQSCYEIDQRCGEPAACRWLLNWYDEMPRDEMRPALLAEVRLESERRKGEADAA